MTATIQKDFYGLVVDDTGKVIGVVNRYGVQTPIGSIPDSVFASLADTWMANGGHAQQHAGMGVMPRSPAGNLVARLEEGLVDCAMLVVGDSTGNDSIEWVDQFCAWAATKWPAYTIRRQLWDNSTKTYATSQDFNTGTSARVFTVWNCSVPGSKLCENFGSPFVSAFVGKDPQLIMINHGYNYPQGVPFYSILGAFSAGTESLLREYPDAGVILVAQSPAQANDLQAINIRAVKDYAAMRGFGVADVYSAYMKAGKPSAWYLDGIHPSQIGGQVWFGEVKPFFLSNRGMSSLGSMFDVPSQNLLLNGDFSSVTGSLPDNWTLTNATSALETTIYERGPRAIKVTANGATPRMQQDILAVNPNVAKQVVGGYVTLAVRVYLPAGSSGSAGTIALRTDAEIWCSQLGANSVTGGFFWVVVSAYVPRNTPFLRAYLYADTATGTTQYAIFDRAILVKGLLPMDMY